MKKFVFAFLKYFGIAVMIIIVTIPIVWVMSLGFRYAGETTLFIPTKLTIQNIPRVITDIGPWLGVSFFRAYANSMFISIVSVAGILIVSSLAAFGFSQYKFKGKELFFILLLITIFLPTQVLLIPLVKLMRIIGLGNNFLSVILPYIALCIPLATLILRGFFEQIPKEIKEAARIDGASNFMIFSKIILPISRGALATVIIICFLYVYNEFIFALTFLGRGRFQTIPVLLNKMTGTVLGSNYELYGAMLFLTIFPMIVIFIIFQKWFIRGLTEGAIKG